MNQYVREVGMSGGYVGQVGQGSRSGRQVIQVWSVVEEVVTIGNRLALTDKGRYRAARAAKNSVVAIDQKSVMVEML